MKPAPPVTRKRMATAPLLVGGADHRSLPEPEPRPDGEGQAGPVGCLDQLDLAPEDRGQQPGVAGQGRRGGPGGGPPRGGGGGCPGAPPFAPGGAGGGRPGPPPP